MGALIVALVPLLEGLLGGQAIGAVLSGLSFAQWGALAAALANLLAPEAEKELEQFPVLKDVLALPVIKDLSTSVKTYGAELAAHRAFTGVAAFGFEQPNNPGIFNQQKGN